MVCIDKRTANLINRCSIPIEEIKRSTKFLFDNTYFIFNNKYYKQTFGSPMGSPISLSLSLSLSRSHVHTCRRCVVFSRCRFLEHTNHSRVTTHVNICVCARTVDIAGAMRLDSTWAQPAGVLVVTKLSRNKIGTQFRKRISKVLKTPKIFRKGSD